MKGDFTRNTFDARNFFNRVLMQQGRVTLDADFNEQIDILLHYLQNLARDVIGPYAAPSEDPGFKITALEDGLWISAGRYYVDGILVENRRPCLYTEQPYFKVPADDPLLAISVKKNPDKIFWLYLDVWERHLTAIESDGIREKALGGPDTCTRTQYVWQVKALSFNADELGSYYYPDPYRRLPYQYSYEGERDFRCDGPLNGLVDLSTARMAARVDPGKKNLDACTTAPDSKYRGVENHLYRVEIHRGGTEGTATFKWSRDNGSVVTAWLDTKSSEGKADLMVTSTRGFSAGCWVELTDENDDLHERTGTMVRVAKVGSGVLSLDSGASLPDRTKLNNPKVRRWDQTETGDIQLDGGAVKAVETDINSNAANWIDLEDGIQIAFTQSPFSGATKYRTGDYWLIPARVATGSIEWPPSQMPGKMAAMPGKMAASLPRGVRHHYAPLALVGWSSKTNKLEFKSCHCEFEPINSCAGERRRYKGFGEQNLSINPSKEPLSEKEVPADVKLGQESIPPAKRSRTRRKPQ